MSRGAKILLGTLVVLLVVAGAAYGLDRYLLARTEASVEDELSTSFPEVTGDVDVEIGGFLFLPQLLLGELEDVRFAADGATYEGMTVTDLDVRMRGLATGEPRTVEHVDLALTLPAETLRTAVADAEDVPDGVTIDVVDGRLVAQAQLLGLPITIGLAPEVTDGGTIALTLTSFALGGLEVGADELPPGLLGDLDGMEVPLEGLPQGVTLTDLTVLDSGVRVTLTGADVSLDQL